MFTLKITRQNFIPSIADIGMALHCVVLPRFDFIGVDNGY
jgi:hypothetical protein